MRAQSGLQPAYLAITLALLASCPATVPPPSLPRVTGRSTLLRVEGDDRMCLEAEATGAVVVGECHGHDSQRWSLITECGDTPEIETDALEDDAGSPKCLQSRTTPGPGPVQIGSCLPCPLPNSRPLPIIDLKGRPDTAVCPGEVSRPLPLRCDTKRIRIQFDDHHCLSLRANTITSGSCDAGAKSAVWILDD
jgi:hypothetical protein